MGQPTALDRALVRSDVCNRLARALQRCEGADGRIARRNARARVLAALRAVRSHLDKEFPAIIVRRSQVKGRTARQRANTATRKLRKAGWVADWDLDEPRDIAMFAAAGVPIKRVGFPGGGYHMLVPGWAVAIGAVNQAQLRAAKKSKQLRDAALAQAALLQET